MTKIISIITVVYNNVENIEKTIRSVIKQKNNDVEYIIIDGGSSDGTLDEIYKYKNDIDTIISENDNGIYHAMNKGIELAQGNIIGILNSGDTFNLETIDIVRKNYLLKGDSYIYNYSMRIIDENEQSKVINRTSNDIRIDGRLMMFLNHPALFVPKKIYDNYGLYDERMKISADKDFVYRLILNGVEIMFYEKITTNMSKGGISQSKGNFKARLYDNFLIANKIWNNKIHVYTKLSVYLLYLLISELKFRLNE